MIELVGWFLGDFHVAGLWPAILAAVFAAADELGDVRLARVAKRPDRRRDDPPTGRLGVGQNTLLSGGLMP